MQVGTRARASMGVALVVAVPLWGQDSGMGSMHMDMGSTPLGIPMSRMGSGTSWLPDETRMHAEHAMAGGWQLMLHYQAFATYDHQESRRDIDGAAQINGIDWFMGMAQHDVGAGRLGLRAMLSTDPFTVGKAGYPLLLQTGESYRGQPLHDRQHPHDLFMEIAALYDVPVTSRVGVELYVAPVGEPALGPVAYPHRPSAAGDPFAVLAHHWQDATHVSFGVATAGIFTHDIKLEGSIFNGREPDETRTNFDFRMLDSYSGRVTINPAPAWSVSASYGYLKSPEQLTPTISQHRASASVLFDRPFNGSGEWSTALVYGANLFSDSPVLSNSATVETTLDVDGRNTVFARVEYVNKDAHDLALGAAPPADRFDVESGSLGYTRELTRVARIAIGLGGIVMIDLIPASLRPYYGTRTPYGFGLFLRFRP